MEYPFYARYYQVSENLWAGFYPGDLDPVTEKEKLRWLLVKGITRFINLTEEREFNHDGISMKNYETCLLEAARELGIPDVQVRRFPVRDLTAPDAPTMESILDAIDEELGDGKGVYVHCWGGHGRTGCVVGCWLARHGHAAGRGVLELLDKLRKGDPTGRPSPETTEQIRMVLNWPQGR